MSRVTASTGGHPPIGGTFASVMTFLHCHFGLHVTRELGRTLPAWHNAKLQEPRLDLGLVTIVEISF